MKSIAFGHRAHKYIVGSAALILLLNISVLAQRSSGEWYYSSITERGQLSELKDKRRVYLSVAVLGGAFVTPSYDYQRIAVAQQVYQEIKQYGELELVKTPDQAEFIIDVWVTPLPWQPAGGKPAGEQSADIKFSVYTRSQNASNGSYGRRMITQSYRTAHADVAPIVRQEAASFIRELRKVQGK